VASAAGIPVTPYLSPLLPRVTDVRGVFSLFEQADEVGFEGLNFNLGNIDAVIAAVGSCRPAVRTFYRAMVDDRSYYDEIWREIRQSIVREAIKAKKNHYIYIHPRRAISKNGSRRNTPSRFRITTCLPESRPSGRMSKT